MKVSVDRNRCTGHARCWAEGPDVFVLDDLGYNSTDVDSIPAELQEQARRGVWACPENALTVVED